jgi:hypothetical protein
LTLIGAFKCRDGAVLLADRQETIADYAKWDGNKIMHLELANSYRILMAGAGDSDTIDMLKEVFTDAWRNTLTSIPAADIKPLIVRTVEKITKKCVLPWPQRDRPWMNLIWAIHQVSPSAQQQIAGVDLFRTSGLTVHGMLFVVNQPVDLVVAGKAANFAAAMLKNP